MICARPMFLDGGKTVVFQFHNDPVLHYWDVGTGAKLRNWEPIIPLNNSAREFTWRGSDRFLVADLDPNVKNAPSRPVPFLDDVGDWISRRLPDGPSSARVRSEFLSSTPSISANSATFPDCRPRFPRTDVGSRRSMHTASSAYGNYPCDVRG